MAPSGRPAFSALYGVLAVEMEWIKVGIEGAMLAASVIAGWATMRAEVKSARAEGAEAMKVGSAAHKRIDDHERRLSAAERDILNQGKNLELALARLEGQVSAMSGRFDSLLLRLTLPGGQGK